MTSTEVCCVNNDQMTNEDVEGEVVKVLYNGVEEVRNHTPMCQKPCEMASCGNVANWLCKTCPLSLCDTCKDQHLGTSIWREHEAVPIDEGGALIINKCTKHPSDIITHFCVDCDSTVCIKCIPEHHHDDGRGHLFLSLSEAKSKKISELEKFSKNLQEKIHPTFEVTKKLLGMKEIQFVEKLKQLIAKIDAQKKFIIENTEKISDELKIYVKQYEEECRQEMTRTRSAIEEGCDKILTVKQQCADLHNAHLDAISDFLRNRSDFETMNPPLLPVICPPLFLTGVIKPLQLERHLGCIIRPEHICEFLTAYPPNNILIDEMSSTSNRVVLCNENSKQLLEMNFHGPSLHRKGEIQTDIRPFGLAKADGDKLLVSDRDNHRILRVKKTGKYEKRIDTKSMNPRGILVNNRGEIVVCLSGISGKICIYSHDGKYMRQEIEDIAGRTLVYSPQKTVQNFNGDYIIIDKNINQYLIVALHEVASGYRKRWTFQGRENMKNAEFRPEGLVCDKMGNILVSDFSQDEVIILSKDGKYLDCLLTSENGISKPLGLAIDSSGKLWVGQNDGDTGKLAVFKYLID